MIAAILAALSLGAADPCAPIERAATPDPRSASAYRAVGQAEAASGSQDTAILAYRRAAALDPDDRASRAALERYCRAGPRKDPARDGMAKMDSGDLRGAIADFRSARAEGEDPSLALLEGICHYQLGEDRDAEAALRVAERAPGEADLARLYLGLLALREGSATRAASLFDAASRASSCAAEPIAALPLAASKREAARVAEPSRSARSPR